MNWMDKQFDFEAGAIVNINKPVGRTSFWVVKKVRHIVKTKVGHAGTLDPFAEGVLLICTGKATKQVARLMDLSKEYIGEIEFGIETDTDDRTGTITRQQKVPELDREKIEHVCAQFVGNIYQIPPMFSAKKVKGKRLYQIARTGKTIEREPKQVHIKSIDVLSVLSPIVKIKVECSKGTYIRALARDIGREIGVGGHLRSLVRTRIGEYKIADALTLDQFERFVNQV